VFVTAVTLLNGCDKLASFLSSIKYSRRSFIVRATNATEQKVLVMGTWRVNTIQKISPPPLPSLKPEMPQKKFVQILI